MRVCDSILRFIFNVNRSRLAKTVSDGRKMVPNYTIRSMTKDDIPGVIIVAKQSTFQFSNESLNSWLKHDPDGIKIAVTDSSEVIGVCGNVIHNEKFSFGGTFCVLEKYRLLDIGHQLFATCFEHGGGRNIGLNCSSDKVNPYRRRGFTVLEDSWSTVEYEHFEPVDPSPLTDLTADQTVQILDFQPSHLPAMFDYDRSIVGYDRKIILEASCLEDNTKTLVAFSKEGTCIGFGSVKLNIFEHSRVGPLYADDSNVAEAILKKLLTTIPPDKGLAMVTMSSNFAANQLLKKMSVPVHDNLLRLYTKDKLKVDPSKIYAQFDVDFSPF